MKSFASVLWLCICICVLFTASAMAQASTTFEWDLSTSEPLGDGGGYRLYSSKHSGQYTSPEENATENNLVGTVAPGVSTVTIDTSAYRGRWYFIATAFIQDQCSATCEIIESDRSNEISAVWKPNPPGNLRKVVNAAMIPAKGVKKAATVIAEIFGKKKTLRMKS